MLRKFPLIGRMVILMTFYFFQAPITYGGLVLEAEVNKKEYFTGEPIILTKVDPIV